MYSVLSHYQSREQPLFKFANGKPFVYANRVLVSDVIIYILPYLCTTLGKYVSLVSRSLSLDLGYTLIHLLCIIISKLCYYLHFYKFYSYFNLISLSAKVEIHYYFYILSTHIIPNLYCTHIQIILLFVTRIWKPYGWHLRARN